MYFKDGWIHSGYVKISSCTGSSTHALSNVQLPGCPNIVTRSEWNARAPTQSALHLPGIPTYMFIHHGASGPCFTKADCIHKVKQYQDYHMDGHGMLEI